MDYFAGLDVSVKETSVCIVDDAGRLVREADIARGILRLIKPLSCKAAQPFTLNYGCSYEKPPRNRQQYPQ